MALNPSILVFGESFVSGAGQLRLAPILGESLRYPPNISE
jgi:hypothetical protein